MTDPKTQTLYRPVGLFEWQKILSTGCRRFPPRFPFQPIFYPVLNAEYAASIAKDWNTVDNNSGFAGFVTEFRVDAAYVSRFERKQVGAKIHEELWVPAEELETFNDHIVGTIEVIEYFLGDTYKGPSLDELEIASRKG